MRPVYSPTAMGEIEEPHRITLTGAIALRLLAPAVIGGATGAFVAVASWLTEDRALGALASLPGAWPALFSPLALLATLLVRTAGTLTCVYGGGGGGVFTSLACTGVFIGQIVAELLGRTESYVFPFLGAACFLGSGYRLPLACMMFVLEGANSIGVAVVGLVAVAIGQVLMGRESVSDAKHEERLD